MRASSTVSHQELDLLCQFEFLYILLIVLRLVPDKRRIGANRAYLVQSDGIHIKRVVPRPVPEPVQLVPYLPGQEDIQHSDDESSGFESTIANTCNTAKYQTLGNRLNTPDKTDDLLDYDAEGEDNDEYTNANTDMDIDDLSVDNNFDHSSTGPWGCSLPNQPVNLLANASKEDIQALFSGFDSMHFNVGSDSFDQPDYFSDNFRAFDPPVPQMWSNFNGDPGSGSYAPGTQEPFSTESLGDPKHSSRSVESRSVMSHTHDQF
ncbi:hypothetical protein RhiLY_09718 [Ceratobasidium sp. AG-Ba]|nr:hypothetical protein RhiLY_09718 [Ceratobasidium sp. AG-Ba]